MPIRPNYIPRIRKKRHGSKAAKRSRGAAIRGSLRQDSSPDPDPNHQRHDEGPPEESDSRYNVELEPTLAHVDYKMVGRPCKKPIDSSSRINPDTAKRNRRIVSLNVRRKKMIVWLLLCAITLVWIGFFDVFSRLRKEKSRGFTMRIIKPWLVPILSTEALLTGTGILVMILKMKFLKANFMNRLFRVMTSLNNLHYLIVLVALPCGTYFFFSELSKDMKRSLNEIGQGKGLEVGPEWNTTQSERKCCGFHSRYDWQGMNNVTMLEYEHDHQDTDDNYIDSDQTQSEIPTREYYYPLSCCNSTAIDIGGFCTESSKLFYLRGCHDVEFFVMLDYFVCVVGLMLLALILNVLAKIWIEKTARYLTIFRPYEMF